MPETSLSGRRTLIALNVFRLIPDFIEGIYSISLRVFIRTNTKGNYSFFLSSKYNNFPKKMSTYAVVITIKSKIFQTLRRYEFLCNNRPNAIILHDASTQNMARKYGSVFSRKTAIGVRSLPGICFSDAMTRQFVIMVTRITHSKGGHSIKNFINFRNG